MNIMQRLNVKKIRETYHGELASSCKGDQIRVDHIGCSAGEDTRGRLYIKNTGEAFVAYCHNCGSSGSWTAGQRSWFKRRGFQKAATQTEKVELPSNMEYDLDQWPLAAQLWIAEYFEYSASQFDLVEYGIGWSEYHHRLVLPFYLLDELAGYQTRRILRSDEGPKYLTYRNKSLPGANLIESESAPLVIVEDILSSIKVSQAGYSALALLSSNMNGELLTLVNKLVPPKVYIWLDDDNHQVRKHQRDLAKRIGLTYPVELVRTNGRDPKAHSIFEIKELLK